MADKNVDIEIEGIDNLIEQFRKAPRIVTNRLHEALLASTIIAQGDIRKETPVDRNRLRNSIVIQQLGKLAFSVGTNVKYALYVHEGTKPHRAPYKPIKRWADRRGIPAYPVWLKIQRKGTKANPFFDRGVKAAEPAINRQFKSAGRLITKDINNG